MQSGFSYCACADFPDGTRVAFARARAWARHVESRELLATGDRHNLARHIERCTVGEHHTERDGLAYNKRTRE